MNKLSYLVMDEILNLHREDPIGRLEWKSAALNRIQTRHDDYKIGLRRVLLDAGLLVLVVAPSQTKMGEIGCVTQLSPEGFNVSSTKKFFLNRQRIREGEIRKAWQEKYWWLIALITAIMGALITLGITMLTNG